MDTIIPAIQIIVGLGIYNVWLLRLGWSTHWRGGEAKSLREEFAVYGLPTWSFYLIGALKLASATALIAGVWYPVLTRPAAAAMTLLMAGAVSMHFKVGDPPLKSLPAFTMLVLSVALAVLSPGL